MDRTVHRARWVAALLLLLTAAMAEGWGADRSPAARQYTIFMVLWRGMTRAEEGFRAYLARRGVAVRYLVRDCRKDKRKIGRYIEEINAVRPDLVYTFGTTVTQQVAGTIDHGHPRAVGDIPIVFGVVSDPVGARLAADLASSGRNVTGVSHSVPLRNQIGTMKALRRFERLGVVYNPEEENVRLALGALKRLAIAEGFAVVAAPVALGSGKVAVRRSLRRAVEGLARVGSQWIYIPADSLVISHAKAVVDYATGQGIPTFSATEGPIRDAGAMAGVVSLYFNVGQFAAHKAAQILVEGVEAENIPIEYLKRFTLLVNMGTSRKLAIYPPVDILRFAAVVDS